MLPIPTNQPDAFYDWKGERRFIIQSCVQYGGRGDPHLRGDDDRVWRTLLQYAEVEIAFDVITDCRYQNEAEGDAAADALFAWTTAFTDRIHAAQAGRIKWSTGIHLLEPNQTPIPATSRYWRTTLCFHMYNGMWWEQQYREQQRPALPSLKLGGDHVST